MLGTLFYSINDPLLIHLPCPLRIYSVSCLIKKKISLLWKFFSFWSKLFAECMQSYKSFGNMPQNCLVMATALHHIVSLENLTWKGNKTISVWKVRKADWKVRNGVGKEGEEEGIFQPLHCNVRYSRIQGKEQYSTAHYSKCFSAHYSTEYSRLQYSQ